MVETKTILITGCSSGIGLHAAHELKKRGYRVFASARKKDDVLTLNESGLETIQLDLANSASIKTAIDFVLSQTGGYLFALFNNGAYGQPGAVEDLSREALREQFEVNLFGTHELTQLILPVMRKQGYGRIIQNSSILGLVALKYRGAYTSSKFALEALTDTLRQEFAGTRIYFSLIEPGPIESKFRKNSYTAYCNYIDKENSPHRSIYQSLEDRLLAEGPAVPFTLGPEAVTKKLIHALESNRPKTRYCVTFPSYLFSFLKRVLPSRALDMILERI